MNLTQGENRELEWLIEWLKEMARDYRAIAAKASKNSILQIRFDGCAAGLEMAVMEAELLQAVGIEGRCPIPEQPGR